MDTILHVSTWQRPGRLCTTDSAQGGSVGLCAKEIGSLPPKKDTAMEAFLVDVFPPQIWRKSFGAVSIYAGEWGVLEQNGRLYRQTNHSACRAGRPK